jgi:hypothetical protein
MSYNLFGNLTPASNATNGPDTFGVAFSSLLAGNVLGIRFYKTPSNTGTHIGTLWSATGTNLAQVTFSGETGSGWQYQAFSTPYPITAGTVYVASYYCPGVNYGYTASEPAVVGQPLGNPLNATPTYSYYHTGSGNTFPATPDGVDYYFVDLVLDNVVAATSQRDRTGVQGVVCALQGISLGAPSSGLGDNTYSRHLQTGVREEFNDGYPSPPCLALDYPGFWRFRWQVIPGSQTLSCYAKQVSNVTGLRPTMVVKANPAIGFPADVVTAAGSSTGWIKVGPMTAVVSAPGVLWVELHNNDTNTFQSTAYFDNIGV